MHARQALYKLTLPLAWLFFFLSCFFLLLCFPTGEAEEVEEVHGGFVPVEQAAQAEILCHFRELGILILQADVLSSLLSTSAACQECTVLRTSPLRGAWQVGWNGDSCPSRVGYRSSGPGRLSIDLPGRGGDETKTPQGTAKASRATEEPK